jgi:uncharacterized protein
VNKTVVMPMPAIPENLADLSLAQIAEMAAARALPPVETWRPTKSGDSAMRIARDGTWFHEGSPITRKNMVRLFSSILRREEDGSYVLVTPAERLTIAVDDAPFIAVEMKSDGKGEGRRLAFRLNTGDMVVAGHAHPITVRGTLDEPAPYIDVRGGMEARIGRAVFYELANMAIDEDSSPLGIWSNGSFFALDPNEAEIGPEARAA